jgi:hypothetical protein
MNYRGSMNNATLDGIYANGRTYLEHCAWLASLKGDDYRKVYTPVGHLENLVEIAYFKRALLKFSLPPDLQLRILEFIASCADGCLSAEAIAAVQPSCDTAAEILNEFNKLDPRMRRLTWRDRDMFSLYAKMNPSLLIALRLCSLNGHIPGEGVPT